MPTIVASSWRLYLSMSLFQASSNSVGMRGQLRIDVNSSLKSSCRKYRYARCSLYFFIMCQRHSLCNVFLKTSAIAKAIAGHWSGNEKIDSEWSADGCAYIPIELTQHFYCVTFLFFFGRGVVVWGGFSGCTCEDACRSLPSHAP